MISVFHFFVFQAITNATIKGMSNQLKTLPNIIRSNVPGTWAYGNFEKNYGSIVTFFLSFVDTMNRRIKDEIIPRIISDNAEELTRPTSPLRSEAFMILNDLKSNLEFGRLGYLRGISDNGPDLRVWDNILSSLPEQERNWLDAPWLVSEFYFYRRVMEAFRFFETGYDPFLKQKVNGLLEALPSIEDVTSRLPGLLEQPVPIALEIAIKTSLWGNKMDLSLWPAKKQAIQDTQGNSRGTQDVSYDATIAAGRYYILDDHTSEVVSHLLSCRNSKSTSEVDIVVDNAGYELVTDLLLGYVLLETGVADVVTFHTKGHPTFVSDATTSDVLSTIDLLSQPVNNVVREATSTVALKLNSYVQAGKIRIVDDLYWCQPFPFWEMPESVRQKLERSSVVFVKGDANYRRMLGDRECPLDEPATSVFDYWKPIPVCPLRTCKAELGCGIPVAEQARAASEDKNWLVSGRWGVVQLGGVE